MKKTTLIVMVALSVAGLQPVSAQDGDEPATYVYVTYFECNSGREYRADEIIERSFKPHYDAAVEAGEIVQWSWLAHFMGGKWRRALVLTTGNMDDLLAAAGALGEAIAELTPEAGRVFTEICPIHEDYIWQTVADIGETAATEQRGAVGFSTYMDCDINRQERADEIMRETIGAIYDARVANGDLTSWTWLTHIVGGQWRRLLSLTATDHNSMMRVRSEIVGELRTGRVQRAFNQLNEICTDHHDYLWDIQHETR